jgi:hypothetical protein
MTRFQITKEQKRQLKSCENLQPRRMRRSSPSVDAVRAPGDVNKKTCQLQVRRICVLRHKEESNSRGKAPKLLIHHRGIPFDYRTGQHLSCLRLLVIFLCHSRIMAKLFRDRCSISEIIFQLAQLFGVIQSDSMKIKIS